MANNAWRGCCHYVVVDDTRTENVMAKKTPLERDLARLQHGRPTEYADYGWSLSDVVADEADIWRAGAYQPLSLL